LKDAVSLGQEVDIIQFEKNYFSLNPQTYLKIL